MLYRCSALNFVLAKERVELVEEELRHRSVKVGRA